MLTINEFIPEISDDSSRVKLKVIAGEDGSDYINASHLDVSKAIHMCSHYIFINN